jgi:aryl-alcohol dehydrogenase-like predicted oxidoreductase
VLALGSWRTFERLTRQQGLAVMTAARDAGITFLDDARYDDETGEAPLPTGWSEVVFGELFREAGWRRDEVVVANKLWWEHWPARDAAAELDGSLERMGFGHVDLIYTMPPPDGLAIADLVAEVGGLVASGRARAWGIGNWTAPALADAVVAAREQGLPRPAAAQLPYHLGGTDWVEDPAMEAVLRDGDIGLVASFVLAGGVLTGKYQRGETGRATTGGGGQVDGRLAATAAELVALADDWGTTPAALALSFALDHPRLASLLFGATSPEQLAENVGALALHDALDASQRARLRVLAAPA